MCLSFKHCNQFNKIIFVLTSFMLFNVEINVLTFWLNTTQQPETVTNTYIPKWSFDNFEDLETCAGFLFVHLSLLACFFVILFILTEISPGAFCVFWSAQFFESFLFNIYTAVVQPYDGLFNCPEEFECRKCHVLKQKASVADRWAQNRSRNCLTLILSDNELWTSLSIYS